MSSSALARAVRDRIRLHASFSDKTREVTVEIDERAPSTASDLHIIVMPGGTEAGPTLESSGCVIDKLYGIDVAIALRAPKRPRDRSRDAWIDTTESFDTLAADIESQIEFNYPTLDAANVYILAESSSAEGFMEPLKFAGIGPIREAPAELFAGFDDPVAAYIRTIQFRNARRIVTR